MLARTAVLRSSRAHVDLLPVRRRRVAEPRVGLVRRGRGRPVAAAREAGEAPVGPREICFKMYGRRGKAKMVP